MEVESLPTIETDPTLATMPVKETGRLTRGLLSTPFLGTVIAFLSWPIVSIAPQVGPDPSWTAGLYMAHAEGLQFGTQFVFTYGPLGFLQVPALYGEALWMLAFAYRGLLYVGLAISLVWAARRAFPLAVAVAGCYVLLAAGYAEEAALLVALVWCLAALEERPPRFALPLVAFGGAVFGAIELLGKANSGIGVLALCGLTLVGIPGRLRNVSRFTAAALAALIGLWLLAGQALANLPAFAASLPQVVGGYSQAMSTSFSDLTWQLPAALGAMALLTAAAWLATWRHPLPRRLATIAVVAVFSFLCFKQGFVRQGLGSELRFFAMMLGAGIALAPQLPRRLPKLPPRFAAFALATPLMAVTIAAIPNPSPWEPLAPKAHLEFLREDFGAFFSPSDAGRLRDEGRGRMRSFYEIDRRTLRLVAHRPVAVYPWEIAAAWAYGLNWRPLPVIQGYAAYTPALDRLDANALSGTDGPALILRQSTAALGAVVQASIDDRNPAWDPPATTLAMLCHYRAIRTTGRWQVLARAPNRCGPPRLLHTAVSATGQQIAIPPAPPGDVVFARIYGIGVEGWESLRSVLYRARTRTITLDGRTTWRLVPATATDGLIMQAPHAIDFPRPFRLAPDAHTMSVQIDGSPSRKIEVRFFTQRVH